MVRERVRTVVGTCAYGTSSSVHTTGPALIADTISSHVVHHGARDWRRCASVSEQYRCNGKCDFGASPILLSLAGVVKTTRKASARGRKPVWLALRESRLPSGFTSHQDAANAPQLLLLVPSQGLQATCGGMVCARTPARHTAVGPPAPRVQSSRRRCHTLQ